LFKKTALLRIGTIMASHVALSCGCSASPGPNQQLSKKAAATSEVMNEHPSASREIGGGWGLHVLHRYDLGGRWRLGW
jgi:hypothetical protein